LQRAGSLPRCAGTCVGAQVRKCAGAQVRKCAGAQVCKCAGVRKCAGTITDSGVKAIVRQIRN